MFIAILMSSKPKSNVCQNYDEHNVNRTTVLYLQFHTFYNINILNTLVFGIALPGLMYWCLYSFVFGSP